MMITNAVTDHFLLISPTVVLIIDGSSDLPMIIMLIIIESTYYPPLLFIHWWSQNWLQSAIVTIVTIDTHGYKLNSSRNWTFGRRPLSYRCVTELKIMARIFHRCLVGLPYKAKPGKYHSLWLKLSYNQYIMFIHNIHIIIHTILYNYP